MKNIHILPTDKPSRLRYFSGKLELMYLIPKKSDIIFQNIYITSDEEIKEGDYCISHLNVIDEGKIHNTQTIFNPKTKEDLIALQSCKKIILTTDQDLIKDGVQPIDDTFLEWFVKNPSCEEVEVETETKSIQLPQQQLSENSYSLDFRWINKQVYKIIIPQEEPKTNLDRLPFFELVKEFAEYYENVPLVEEPKPIHKFNNGRGATLCGKCGVIISEGITEELYCEKCKHKQETTLEEKAEEYEYTDGIYGFKAGAKWQAKRTCKHTYTLTTEQGHRVIKCSKCNDTQPI
jgi:hypothetical protein